MTTGNSAHAYFCEAAGAYAAGLAAGAAAGAAAERERIRQLAITHNALVYNHLGTEHRPFADFIGLLTDTP